MVNIKVLIAAAGLGSRSGLNYPKTLFSVKGKPILILKDRKPKWISAKMAKKIEKLQKTVVYVNLGSSADPDYFCNLAISSLDSLNKSEYSIVSSESAVFKLP